MVRNRVVSGLGVPSAVLGRISGGSLSGGAGSKFACSNSRIPLHPDEMLGLAAFTNHIQPLCPLFLFPDHLGAGTVQAVLLKAFGQPSAELFTRHASCIALNEFHMYHMYL